MIRVKTITKICISETISVFMEYCSIIKNIKDEMVKERLIMRIFESNLTFIF